MVVFLEQNLMRFVWQNKLGLKSVRFRNFLDAFDNIAATCETRFGPIQQRDVGFGSFAYIKMAERDRLNFAAARVTVPPVAASRRGCSISSFVHGRLQLFGMGALLDRMSGFVHMFT